MIIEHTVEDAVEEAAGRIGAVREYRSYVGGRDLPAGGWVYTLTARSLLEDVFTSARLKRRLEKDPNSPELNHPYVAGRVAAAADEEIDAAVDAAAAAAGTWATTPLATRMLLGRRFREELLRRREEFVDMVVSEGHPRRLAQWELTCLLQIFSDESLAWYEEQMYVERQLGNRRLIVRRVPDGVVCVNPPQNAPAPSSGLTVLALMAGNTAVVRAPRSIALSTMYLMRDVVAPLLDDLGAPPGTLNVLCGQPRRMIDRWLAHPDVDDIFFIGDSAEGLDLQARCLAQGKKPILELAGNDGLVVWHDADLDLAVEAITECFFGSGQICMVPKYVVVHPDIAEDLTARLVAAIAAEIRPGYPDAPDTLLSPVRRTERFFAQLDQALAGGAELVCGGRRTEVDGTPSETGVFLQPTVLRVAGLTGARQLDVVRHETFYPLLPLVVPEAAPDEVLLDLVVAFVDDNEYGLRNSLWTSDPAVVDTFLAGVRHGGLLKINDSHIGFLPFLPTHGGTGLTGGAFGEANYPILKTSHLQGVSIADAVRPRDAVFDV